MSQLVTLSTCSLNQWAMDFEGNRDRIIESIRIAKAQGSHFRTGPELEITGYGCLDHFLETDTYRHSWEMAVQIIKHPDCQDILVDLGMPIYHKSLRFNCRVVAYNGQLLLIRPKQWLANDGNYREMRYFNMWQGGKAPEQHILPAFAREQLKQREVTFGNCKLAIGETAIGFETCEELFTPHSPHIELALDGVEIFTNSSGSHHELRKLSRRLDLIQEATRKCGGVYLYANQRGCDGDRLYYDGSAMIVVNGEIVKQGSQFSLKDVEVLTATVDLHSVRVARSAPSFGAQSILHGSFHSVKCDELEARLTGETSKYEFKNVASPKQLTPQIYSPSEEVALGPACWLWDYLRRSNSGGYFLPLSGGIDSCATATIVYSMCNLVINEIKDDNELVLKDIRRLCQKENTWTPSSPQEICNLIFYTCYMGTTNSSHETRDRARRLAEAIGSYHLNFDIDTVVSPMVSLFETVTGKKPIYKVFGGSDRENLALQNIQARLRMVLAYLFALLSPWTRKREGSLLVLGSANVDESLRGYLTKYDASSADINPIGSLSKNDLKSFIAHAKDKFELPVLGEFLSAVPTAELEPTTEDYVQNDEADMGLTYNELSVFGKLRKVEKLGPYSTFLQLCHEWSSQMTVREAAVKVKRFFYFYAINRHKMTVLTPAYHAEPYSTDDNRFDMRPFLIPPFPWAFKCIDKIVESAEAGESSSSILTVD